MMFRNESSDSSSPLDPQIAELLRARRTMFDGEPSLLPDFHRRLRASAMHRVSVREAMLARLANWAEEHLTFGFQTGLRYAGAAALLVGAIVVGIEESPLANVSGPVLTLKSEAVPAAASTLAIGSRVDYAMNDVRASFSPASLTLDQQIDRSTLGGDLNATPANAQYILPKAPATYDAVVAF